MGPTNSAVVLSVLSGGPVNVQALGQRIALLAPSGSGVVTPPAATFEAVSTGGVPAGKTFSAFVDTGPQIASYVVTIMNIIGTTSISSGTGLGPYTVTGYSNGDAYVMYLHAKDAGGNILGTAVHGVDIGVAAPNGVIAPAATSQVVSAGGAPSGKSFGAFTDPDLRIASYSASISNAIGTTSISSGSSTGPYVVTGYANGDSYVLILTALDAGGDPLATAVHLVDIAAAATGGAWEVVVDYDLLGIDPVDLSGAATALTMLQKGGIDFLEVTTSRTGTGSFNAAAGANGLTASNVTGVTSGTGNIAWDATLDVSLVGAGTLTWEDWQAPLAIQFLIKDFVWSGSTQWDLIVGFAESLTGPVSVNNSVGWRINDNGANTTFQARRYSGGAVDTNVITGQAYNTDYVLSIIIYGALVAAEWQSAGSTSLPSDPRTGLGPYTPGWGSFGAGSMSVPNNKLCPFLSLAKSSSSGTPMTYNIAGVRILRFT